MCVSALCLQHEHDEPLIHRQAHAWHASMLHASVLSAQITALSALTAAVGTDVSKYAKSNYTTNSTCPTDNTAGGILGDSIGQLTATANMDSSFYSWVGCNCSNGDVERLYNIDTSGDVQYILINCGQLVCCVRYIDLPLHTFV